MKPQLSFYYDDDSECVSYVCNKLYWKEKKNTENKFFSVSLNKNMLVSTCKTNEILSFQARTSPKFSLLIYPFPFHDDLWLLSP